MFIHKLQHKTHFAKRKRPRLMAGALETMVISVFNLLPFPITFNGQYKNSSRLRGFRLVKLQES